MLNFFWTNIEFIKFEKSQLHNNKGTNFPINKYYLSQHFFPEINLINLLSVKIKNMIEPHQCLGQHRTPETKQQNPWGSIESRLRTTDLEN